MRSPEAPRPARRPVLARLALLAAAVALPVAGLAQEASGRVLGGREVSMAVRIFKLEYERGASGAVVERFVEVTEAVPGEEVEYRIVVANEGERTYRAGTVQVTLPLEDGFAYVEGSAGPAGEDSVLVELSTDGGESFADPGAVADPDEVDALRWTLTVPFEPGQEETLFYRVTVL